MSYLVISADDIRAMKKATSYSYQYYTYRGRR